MSGNPSMLIRIAANLAELRTNLKEGRDNIETTTQAMFKMATGLDGSRLEQQAHNIVAAIDKVGGATKLTDAEQLRNLKTLDAYIEKAGLMGKTVPKAMTDMAESLRPVDLNLQKVYGQTVITEEAMGRAGVTTAGVHAVFKQFDGILESMGIHLTRQVKGIEDVTNASLEGSSGFAKYAIGIGGALAAFKTGWDFGRWIADVLGLDDKVAGLAKRLLGLGDVAAETAGAKMDAISRAIANGAKETISYTEAIQFNIDFAKKNGDAHIDWAKRLSDAQREVRGLSDAQKDEIQVAQRGNATIEELTNKYKLSALALSLLSDNKKIAIELAKQHTEAIKKEKEANEKYDIEIADQRVLFDNLEKAATAAMAAKSKQDAAQAWINAMDRSVTATNQQRAADEALQKQQGDGLIIIGQTVDKQKELGSVSTSATDAAKNGFAGVAQQVTVTGDAIKEYINLMRYAAEANAILQGGSSLFTTQSQRERIASLPARAGGGPVSAGMPYVVGELGPEVVVPERSGTVIPNGGSAGGGGVTVTISPGAFVINNPIANDPRSMRVLGDLMTAALLQKLRGAGVPLPVGV